METWCARAVRGAARMAGGNGRYGYRVWLLATLLMLAIQGGLPARCAWGQSVVGCLLSGPEEFWPDMWLDSASGELFIADWTNAKVLIHDSQSLASLGEIALSSFLPDRPYQLAGHEGAGQLYVIVCDGGWSCDDRVIAIDTLTRTARSLPGLEGKRTILVDEQGHRLLATGNGPTGFDPETLTIVDVDTDSTVGSIDINALMEVGFSHIAMSRKLNPVTGEAFFYQTGGEAIGIVNGRTLATERIAAPQASGLWICPECTAWNWLENKLYLTTNTWEGYFILDRDTGESTVTHCLPNDNDGSQLFFSAATNRVYSGAEINAESAVIEGASDTCTRVGRFFGPVVGFVEAARRAFFVGFGVTVLDEDSLAIVGDFETCIPPPDVTRFLSDTSIAVDQANGRVFSRIWEGDDDHMYDNPGPELDYASVLVLQEDAIFCDGFESGTTAAWTMTQP